MNLSRNSVRSENSSGKWLSEGLKSVRFYLTVWDMACMIIVTVLFSGKSCGYFGASQKFWISFHSCLQTWTVPSKIAADDTFIFFLLLPFEENKAWYLSWILCLAEDSHEIHQVLFSLENNEKTWNNEKIFKTILCCSSGWWTGLWSISNLYWSQILWAAYTGQHKAIISKCNKKAMISNLSSKLINRDSSAWGTILNILITLGWLYQQASA